LYFNIYLNFVTKNSNSNLKKNKLRTSEKALNQQEKGVKII